MKQIMTIAAAIVLGLSQQAFGRLGQTEEQVTALFGKPIETDPPDKEGVTTNTYKTPSGEYIALVQFQKGHSIAEVYSRADKGRLSQKEMSTFLQGNSDGKEWIKNPRKLIWERSDHRAKAWYETLGGRPTLLVQAK
ncbi:MAG TPA: hypothetical protein VM940_03500 [Chthoniobacterales bacterium]|jgi:hypothetical protein|nr:hypothetical protein [Chthoniobacterales bacterium]